MWDVAAWLFGYAHGQTIGAMQATPPPRPAPTKLPDTDPARFPAYGPIDMRILHERIVMSRQRRGIILRDEGGA